MSNFIQPSPLKNEPGLIFVDDINGGEETITYLCYPRTPGVTEDQAEWRIKRVKITRSNGGASQKVEVGYPNALTDYIFKPVDRETYTYLFSNQ